MHRAHRIPHPRKGDDPPLRIWLPHWIRNACHTQRLPTPRRRRYGHNVTSPTRLRHSTAEWFTRSLRLCSRDARCVRAISRGTCVEICDAVRLGDGAGSLALPTERNTSMKPLRDFLSVFGCVLLASGLCAFGQGIRAQVGLPGVGSTSGAPSGSGWDPRGKGTQTSLSTTTVANDTAQATSAGFTSVRGMHGRSSGKFYYEVVSLATATGNSGFGSMGASSARELDNPLGFISNSAGVFTGAEHFATGTGWQAVSTGVYRISNANVFGVALDMTNGF